MGAQQGKQAGAGGRTPAGAAGAQRQLRTAAGTNATLVSQYPRPATAADELGPQTASPPAPQEEPKVPVVIRYKVGPTRSQPKPPPVSSVDVALESDGWKRYPLSPSADDFFTVVNLPKGTHAFKFFVNGVEVVDSRQPTRQASATVPAANVVTVSESVLVTREDAEAADDDTEGWGQEAVTFEETRKLPPILPPHLRYTPLNTPPTQYRCGDDGSVTPVAGPLALDPEHLPMPLSATINHVYFQRRDDHVVVGVTTRFKNKFTSVVLYRGDTHGAVPTGAVPVAA